MRTRERAVRLPGRAARLRCGEP